MLRSLKAKAARLKAQVARDALHAEAAECEVGPSNSNQAGNLAPHVDPRHMGSVLRTVHMRFFELLRPILKASHCITMTVTSSYSNQILTCRPNRFQTFLSEDISLRSIYPPFVPSS